MKYKERKRIGEMARKASEKYPETHQAVAHDAYWTGYMACKEEQNG